MQCYTELTPATAVTHSATLQFIPGQGTNLVVAKSSILQIFRTKVVSTEVDASQANGHGARSATRYESRLANDDDGLEAPAPEAGPDEAADARGDEQRDAEFRERLRRRDIAEQPRDHVHEDEQRGGRRRRLGPRPFQEYEQRRQEDSAARTRKSREQAEPRAHAHG